MRYYLLSIILLICVQSTHALSLHYQETGTLSISEPNERIIKTANWSCSYSSWVSVMGDGRNAIVQISQYFTGSATITVDYTYEWWAPTGGTNGTGAWKSGNGRQQWIVMCSPINATLSETDVTMNIGECKTLTYTLDPSNYGRPPQTWTSDNPSVVTVDRNSGELTAYKAGFATITLNPGFGPSVTCNVTVVNNSPTSISLPKSYSIKEGNTYTLVPTISPSNAVYTLTWNSSNKGKVSVSSTGQIKGLADGYSDITATTNNGLSATCRVSVIPLPTAVSINETDINIKVGSQKRLTYSLTPSNAESYITWNVGTGYANIISVNASGVVTAQKPGTAAVTCSTSNGKYSTVTVKVYTPGDVDGDGEICVADLSAITMYLNGKQTPDSFNIKAADANEDGLIDEEDLKFIENMIISE